MITVKTFNIKQLQNKYPTLTPLNHPPYGGPDYTITVDNETRYIKMSRVSNILYKPTPAFRNEYTHYPNLYFSERYGRTPKKQIEDKKGLLTYIVEQYPKPLIIVLFNVVDGLILKSKTYFHGQKPPLLKPKHYKQPAGYIYE